MKFQARRDKFYKNKRRTYVQKVYDPQPYLAQPLRKGITIEADQDLCKPDEMLTILISPKLTDPLPYASIKQIVAALMEYVREIGQHRGFTRFRDTGYLDSNGASVTIQGDILAFCNQIGVAKGDGERIYCIAICKDEPEETAWALGQTEYPH